MDTVRCCRSDAGDVDGAQLLAGGLRRQVVVKFFSGVGPALFDAGAPMFSGPWTMAPQRSGAVGFSRAYCVWQGVRVVWAAPHVGGTAR